MANTLGTLQSSIILQTALGMAVKMRPLLQNISLDLKPQSALKGQTVLSRLHAVATVGDFGDAATDRGDTDVSVVLNQFKQVYHKFTYSELNSTDRNLVRESAEPIAEAIARHMVGAIAGLWTVANYPNESVETVVNCDYQTLTGLRKELNEVGCPEFRRHLTVNSDVYEQFLNDSTIIEADKNRASNAIESGFISGVAGFGTISEFPDMPTGESLIGFAGAPDSVVLATRVPKDPREILPNAPLSGSMGVLTDPATGFSVLVVEHINMEDLSANIRAIFLYGVAKGNATNGRRLVHTATP